MFSPAMTMKKYLTILLLSLLALSARASYLLIPMDEVQKNHLKAYGVAYYALQRDVEVTWLLNYRGGSFMFFSTPPLLTVQTMRSLLTSLVIMEIKPSSSSSSRPTASFPSRRKISTSLG